MELIRGIHNLRPRHRGCVLTIGNFDGVHLGHRAVLARLQEKAASLGLPACVMLFEPQPLELFADAKAPPRLSRLREKAEALQAIGIERLLCVRFNHDFASQSAECFIEELLVGKLGVRYLVVGDDFRFGKGRCGDFHLLEEAGRRFGFEVISTQSFSLSRQRVSSTLVREALAAGRMAEVEMMLGRPYSISGRVAHGDKLGRTIGFPTANLALKRRVAPVSGVYAVEVLCSGKTFPGVANVGQRPTLNGTQARLEVHLFDFSGDLYGQQVQVMLHHKLREEQKFPSFDALRAQIERDAQAARHWFGLPATDEPSGTLLEMQSLDMKGNQDR
ncbi:bifunctional riboflavin kinase/FAD synthetase [Aeromonas simiae]|uniref:bifunctional riboflavin kinase/FAD synthetase n=1 Tax=Aeromonas simiae TaxID=218936 RepID=UPI0005A94181|nr:bifunctional riboflavin kinase/FAD synthetase [Aeromonas simiae]